MNTLFQYLWFVIVVALLIFVLRAMSWADAGSRGTPPEHIPCCVNAHSTP